jgi:hypothetical protein
LFIQFTEKRINPKLIPLKIFCAVLKGQSQEIVYEILTWDDSFGLNKGSPTCMECKIARLKAMIFQTGLLLIGFYYLQGPAKIALNLHL